MKQNLTSEEGCETIASLTGETPTMKLELKKNANRHAERLLSSMREVITVPKVVEDCIRREIEYATMDGYRITMRNEPRNGENNAQQDDSIGNR